MSDLLNVNEREAQRRVREARDLIEAAYRLYPLEPSETIRLVRQAMVEGAQAAADDVREAVERAR